MENLFVKKYPLQDLLSSLNSVISTNESNGILTDQVIFNEIYQMKTTLVSGINEHFIKCKQQKKPNQVGSLDF